MPETWNKELVQAHAQVAVAVELYTLPFYITVLASVQDTKSDAYQLIRSVMIEEMLHLELAANLCLALDTTPNFTAPQYGQPIPYLKPYDPETGDRGFLNAQMGPLNEATLKVMLDIETPEEVDSLSEIDHSTPQYPYDSIGQMYDALEYGMETVNDFSWSTANQQMFWEDDGSPPKNNQPFPQIISSLDDAKQAIEVINEQGEGKAMQPVPQPPYTESDFPVPPADRLTAEKDDPSGYNAYSHYGRFVKLWNEVQSGYPQVYSGTQQPGNDKNQVLQGHFADLITQLRNLWGGVAKANIWGMTQLLPDAVTCWKAGAIPQWTPPSSS